MESHHRDRSVKLASAHDTWRADATGKIGNANTKRTFERTFSFFFCFVAASGWIPFRDRSVKLVSSHAIFGWPTCLGK